MSRDLRNTSLSAQAAQLKKTLENRERRRQADKYARLLEKEDNDEVRPGAASTAGPSGTEARFAALAAIPMHDQQVYRCELCQANFTTDAAYQQHLQSAVHHKALEKAREEEVRIQRMQAAGLHDVQQMALGAAGWSATHDGTGQASGSGIRSHGTGHTAAGRGGRGAAGRGGARGGAQQAAQRNGRPGGAGSSNDVMSHQQVTAAMRAETEPLHIDGWVPPAVNIQPAPADVLPQLPAQPVEDDSLIGVHNLAAGRERAEDSGTPSSSSGGSEQGEEMGAVAGGGDVLGLGYGGDEASTDSADEDSSSSESANDTGQQGTVSFF